MLNRGDHVYVTERPQLRGEVVEVVSETYVKVQFTSVEDIVGVAVERLTEVY